jgi:FkbM family methyltransferase
MTSLRKAAFAIPGDINTVTGGYIYERRLLETLREIGHDVRHIVLGASFPDPTPSDMAHAVDALVALDPERALILDGLVFGSIETAGLAKVRAPIVAMIHHPLAIETGLSAARRDHLFKTERDNLTLATHVLVPSPHTAHILATQYGVAPSRITVAQPGTDPHTATRTPSDPPLILSVGIQHARKGHDILLRALADLRHLDWRAVIVGSTHDPSHAADLTGLVDELGLRNRVVIAGRIPQKALDTLYAQATIFALATRYEGYGIVFDEALSWGLPIVTCDTGAVSQTVPPDSGLLVPPDAPQEFAQAIKRLLSDHDLCRRMADAAQRASKMLPTWRDTAQTAGNVLAMLAPTQTPRKRLTPIGRSLDVYYRDAARTARMDQLNASFVSKGQLAFDIGAHVGDRTASFARLGARVVALEPQPRVFRALRLIHGCNPAVTLRREAVGARLSEIDMHVNSSNPTISTASSDLITAAQSADAWKNEVWDTNIRVPMITLDYLISVYGLPNFVKIDVEGFELEVLKGLSTQLPVFSFEFTTIQRDIAYACINRLTELGSYEFNISLGEDHLLHHDHWIRDKEMLAQVAALPQSANSGDIYARQTTPNR